MRLPVYPDHYVATQLDLCALESTVGHRTKRLGNSSSIDRGYRHDVQVAMKYAREGIVALVGAKPGEMFFTSNSTEPENSALATFLCRDRRPNYNVRNQHRTVLDVSSNGLREQESRLPVDEFGSVDPCKGRDAVTVGTVTVSIIAVNSEVSTADDMTNAERVSQGDDALSRRCCSSEEHVQIGMDAKNIGQVSPSAHMMYDPEGMGVLDGHGIRLAMQHKSILHDGSRENDVGLETPNMHEGVGFGMLNEVSVD